MTCTCICHGGGPYVTCDVNGGYDGGCGYLHDVVEEAGTNRVCARGEQCSGRTPERDDKGTATGNWLPAPIAADRGLCDSCRRDVEHALNHLTGDVVELTMMIGRDGMASEVVVASSPELQVPIRVNIEALRAEIDSELWSWAEPVAEKLGVDWDTHTTNRMRMAVRVQRAAHLLAQAVDTLLALPPTEHQAWEDGLPVWDPDLDCQDTVTRDGVDAGMRLIYLHYLAYAALGRTKLVHRLTPACPWCDHKTLVRYNGKDHVTCEHCHKVIEEKYYDWFVAVLVREEERTRAQKQAEEPDEVESVQDARRTITRGGLGVKVA
jgi:hypothetical protein